MTKVEEAFRRVREGRSATCSHTGHTALCGVCFNSLLERAEQAIREEERAKFTNENLYDAQAMHEALRAARVSVLEEVRERVKHAAVNVSGEYIIDKMLSEAREAVGMVGGSREGDPEKCAQGARPLTPSRPPSEQPTPEPERERCPVCNTHHRYHEKEDK